MNDESFQKYFQEKIVSSQPLNHKGNNHLFHVKTEDSEYLLKRYSVIQKDKWDRGKTEFGAFYHLWNLGFREIPNPIRFYEQDHIGIYSFESGRALKQEEIGKEDILNAANFLAKIHSIPTENKKDFPAERTACLSPIDYLDLIETRFKTISEDFSAGINEWAFLENRVRPQIVNLKEEIFFSGIDLHHKLPLEEQVITPGDFGFHNILVSPGKYTFVDFEFCGRDDPAKQILDFLHHDKTLGLSKDLKDLFLEQYRKSTCHSSDFNERLLLFDSLIGMNWVLIYLNPLSKKYLEHMQFAQGISSPESLIQERIEKASRKLENLSYFSQD